MRLSELLQESLLAVVPSLMRVDAVLVHWLESIYSVAVGLHTERGPSGLAFAAPCLFVHIPLVVKDMVVVGLDGSSLEYTCWWCCRREVVDELTDEELAETGP